ncbi:MAG: cysteine desulfurase [Clostridia bacterium]|nr:cysteine desulfurase [Clostridia bacterium]
MIYLDNSATTPLSDPVKREMIAAMDVFGNPSSLHSAGLTAEKLLRTARERILRALSVKNPDGYRVIFTASGSEANNQILFGVANAKNYRFTPRIVTTDSEHPSVLEPLTVLEKRGFEVVRLSTKNGVIDPSEFRAAITQNTVLVSIMTVNNETGAIYDIKQLFTLAKRINPNVITHTDCVQGFLKVPFSPEAVGCDALSLSAHKIHGPKGVGALVLSRALITAKKVTPLIYGGGQETGLRSGTENTLGIVGFGAAAEDAQSHFVEFSEMMPKLRESFLRNLPDCVRVNQPTKYAPHIISITLPRLRSETVLHYLSAKEIFVSSGSACASNKKGANYVLPAFGLASEDTDTTLRISLSRFVTEDDLLSAADAIREAIDTLVKK